MDPDQRRIAGYVGHAKNNGLFQVGGVVSFETVDAEVTKTAGKISLRDLQKLQLFIIMFDRPRWWNNISLRH